MLADAAQCLTASAESLTDIERTINNPFFLLFETTIVKYTQRSSLTSLYVTRLLFFSDLRKFRRLKYVLLPFTSTRQNKSPLFNLKKLTEITIVL